MRETLLGIVFLIGSMLGITPQMEPVALGDSGTISQLSPFTTTASTTRLASTTAMFRIPWLASCDTIDTDSKGFFTCGTDTGGSGSFPFTSQSYGVSTSTLVNFTAGIMSMSSSTLQILNAGTLTMPSLTLGAIGVDSAGVFYKFASTTYSGGVAWSAGNVTNTLTAGDGLTRNTDDLDCDTASGSVFGCLSSADWTTFNGKADALSGTVSQLAFFNSGGTTLGSVATGTVSAGSGISVTAGRAVIGGALTITNDGVTSISATAPLVNSLSTGAISLTCPQCATFTAIAGGVSTSSLYSFLGGIMSTASSTLQTFKTTDAVVSGSIAIPDNGTVNAAGEITTDSTSGQLRYYTGSAERVVLGYSKAFAGYSTSTAWTGTTTVQGTVAFEAQTFTHAQCYTDAGTVGVAVTDGTNEMNYFVASTTAGSMALSTNNTFTAGEKRYVKFGTPASSPTNVTCVFRFTVTAD